VDQTGAIATITLNRPEGVAAFFDKRTPRFTGQ
jgi:hypothetical protein